MHPVPQERRPFLLLTAVRDYSKTKELTQVFYTVRPFTWKLYTVFLSYGSFPTRTGISRLREKNVRGSLLPKYIVLEYYRTIFIFLVSC